MRRTVFITSLAATAWLCSPAHAETTSYRPVSGINVLSKHVEVFLAGGGKHNCTDKIKNRFQLRSNSSNFHAKWMLATATYEGGFRLSLVYRCVVDKNISKAVVIAVKSRREKK